MEKIIDIIGKFFITLTKIFLVFISLIALQIFINPIVSLIVLNLFFLYLFKDEIKKTKLDIKYLIKITLLVVFIYILILLFMYIYKTSGISLDNFTFISHNILFYIILQTIFEELFFRGLILNDFMGQFKEKTAILITSIFFSLSHLSSPFSFIFVYTFVLSYFFSYLKIKKGLLYSIYAHLLYNLIQLI